MAELIERFSGQLLLLLVIILASGAAAAMVREHRRWPFGIAPAAACLSIGSALAIGVLTLSRQTGARSPGRDNTEPFHTMRGYLGDPSDLAFYLCGNVLIFVPLGFFLYLALRRGVLLPAALTVLASLTVEALQLPIWSRSSDVDDVILNSAGGLAGVIVAVVFARLTGVGDVGRSPGRRHSHTGTELDAAEQRMDTLLPMR